MSWKWTMQNPTNRAPFVAKNVPMGAGPSKPPLTKFCNLIVETLPWSSLSPLRFSHTSRKPRCGVQIDRVTN